MKRPYFISILISLVCYAYGQNDATYSHSMFNHMSVNPGYAGSNDMLCMNLINRNQWMGMGEISPTFNIFNINAPFTLFEKDHGVGLGLLNSNDPVSSNISGKLSYAYRMKMQIGDGRLGIGGSFGFINSGFDLTKAVMEQADPNIVVQKENQTIFDAGLGVFYNTEKLYLGISATHLLAGEYKVSNVPMNIVVPNYYVAAGYTIPLSNPLFELKPSVLLQSDGATTTVNFNSNVMYNNRIWGGLSYRAGSAITALFGMELLPGVRFGIAYDYDTSPLRKVADGSIEAVVIYCFKLQKEKIPQKYKSIRFL